MTEAYRKNNVKYENNRVIFNYSGHRPAEPTTVAISATFHTLTRFILLLVDTVRNHIPYGRIIHPWDKEYVKPENQLLATSFNESTSIFSNDIKQRVIMNLTDGCIVDLHSLVNENVVKNITAIVGKVDKPNDSSLKIDPALHRGSFEQYNPTLDENIKHDLHLASAANAVKNPNDNVHDTLVKQGQEWGKHVSEPWNVLVIAGCYILIACIFDVPLCAILAKGLYLIILAGKGRTVYCLDNEVGCYLYFSVFEIWNAYDMPAVYTVVGAIIQTIDAVIFIYCAKVVVISLVLTCTCAYINTYSCMHACSSAAYIQALLVIL